MYSTCIFCHSALGANEVIEPFPVGRRLAFDAARGRLWVVCPRCGRWNLTPLEERWEAIEQCERRFRETKLRASTDNVGLARLREGLELVRIGAPLRPELAVWRYAEPFRRRRRRVVMLGAASAVGTMIAMGAILMFVAALPPAVFMLSGAVAGLAGDRLLNAKDRLLHSLAPWRVRVSGTGEALELRTAHARAARVVPAAGGPGWRLQIRHESGYAMLEGRDALHAASILLPVINPFGGRRSIVLSASALLDEMPDADAWFRRAATARNWEPVLADDLYAQSGDNEQPEGSLVHVGSRALLVLEMIANEEAERRAMEGELALLEAAWRDAEEIASIADDLLVASPVREALGRLRRSTRAE